MENVEDHLRFVGYYENELLVKSYMHVLHIIKLVIFYSSFALTIITADFDYFIMNIMTSRSICGAYQFP